MEIIDGHAYCFPPLDSPSGIPLEEKMRRIQQELGTHHTFTMRVSDRALVDNSSLIDPETGAFRQVRWKRDYLNRLAWEYEGETYWKGNLPPLLHNAEFQPEQLVAAMDFSQVDMAILHTYPTFGVMSRMHRQAVRRYPDRLRRLVPLPFDAQNPDQFAERVEQEIALGGVCGLQFFTGWYQTRFAGSWDDPQMDAFWKFAVATRLPLYFTLALGHPSQFMEDGKGFYLQELERLQGWMERFPEAVVVLTHGLPWRGYVEYNRIAFPEAIWSVFSNPNCYLQLLLPLRIGDIWDYPYKEVEPTLHQCVERVGVDRLIWGTDMPMLERFCTYSQAIRHISHHTDGLSEENVAQLLGGNARRLLDISDAVSPIERSSGFAPEEGYRSGFEWATSRQAPALMGDELDRVRTPALLVDLDTMKRNMRTMNGILRDFPHVHIRPHSKTHKCCEIAMLQAQEHKSGRICCQKVSEAEAMFEGGLFDILVTNQVVDSSKLRTLADLVLRGARVSICVDSPDQVRLLEDAMAERGVRLSVLVELNVGGERGGVDTAEELVELALQVQASQSLAFGGIQAYQGIAQHVRRHADRQAAVAEARRRLIRARSLAEERDLAVNTITGGGTGTFELEAGSGVYNEVQPGSYIFGDVDYSQNLAADGEPVSTWEQSLFVLATVIGTHERFGAHGSMLDVGLKSVSFDSGPPRVVGHPDVEFVNLGDEHSFVKGLTLPVGTRLKLVPGHCDPTVNLYPYLLAMRGDHVQEVWAVEARGPGV